MNRNKNAKETKIVDREMASLYVALVKNNTPAIDGGIYMNGGLYLYPNGDITEGLEY
tara:strand:- start:2828 stop:2998 length:171 start_codon:yes stop_codon:yes gene_type:complete